MTIYIQQISGGWLIKQDIPGTDSQEVSRYRCRSMQTAIRQFRAEYGLKGRRLIIVVM